MKGGKDGRRTGQRAGSARRRGPADPVRALMHRHRDLCARATHPLEIAAGLEALGFSDRAAARLRHRDVFSLAEELYARVPRESPRPVPGPGPGPRPRPGTSRSLLAGPARCLLPGLCCLAAWPAWQLRRRDALLLLVCVAAAAALSLRICLSRGPLRAPGGALSARWLWTGWLLGFALLGGRALAEVGPGPGAAAASAVEPAAFARFTALAFAFWPAAWCAGWFGRRCHARLATSRSLAEFAAAARRLLLAVLGLFLAALLVLLIGADAIAGRHLEPAGYPAPLALGTLLFTGRLLAVYGHPAAAAAGSAAACLVEAGALALAALGGFPALGSLAPIAEYLTVRAPAVESAACCAAALALSGYGLVALGRASSHRP